MISGSFWSTTYQKTYVGTSGEGLAQGRELVLAEDCKPTATTLVQQIIDFGKQSPTNWLPTSLEGRTNVINRYRPLCSDEMA